jgi:hypothetical protein
MQLMLEEKPRQQTAFSFAKYAVVNRAILCPIAVAGALWKQGQKNGI